MINTPSSNEGIDHYLASTVYTCGGWTANFKVNIDQLHPIILSGTSECGGCTLPAGVSLLNTIKSIWDPSALLADVNGDGNIDVNDLGSLQATLAICPHDVDQDGDTDIDDLLRFLAGFGDSCP